MRIILRVAAAVCWLASMPAACIKYPWLPATTLEFVELQHDAYTLGTDSYHAGLNERRERLGTALVLYILATLSFVALWVIMTGCAPRLHAVSWAIVSLTGAGVAIFEKPALGPDTARFYVHATYHAPLAVAGIATLATIASLVGSISGRRRADQSS